MTSSPDTRTSTRVSSPDEWLALVRWRNAALAAAGVCAGAWWSGGAITGRVGLAALAAIALTAVANTTNDLADIEIDRVAHPERPLPSGAISPRAAMRVAIACSVAALALTVLVDLWLGMLTLSVVAIMWGYSARLKRHGIPGNVAVALLGSLPFLYGGWAVDERAKGVLLVMVAAPLHFAREIAKDLDDATADAGARRTLPVTSGVGAARAAVVGGVIVYAVAVALLARAHPLFATMLVPTIFLAGLATRRLYLGREGSAGLLKAAMVVAIVALFISGG
jgi:geranylgeranylglycerol-phosphate geranylgeranyltransferase